MAIKPILFNTEMVRAILDGRKTCTRRVIKKYNVEAMLILSHQMGMPRSVEKRIVRKRLKAPCDPGDILYVRETWHKYTKLVGKGEGCHPKERYGYKASIANAEDANEPWKPSIHMPKEAARIWLKVTDVRVERLQEISGEGALAEGADKYIHVDGTLNEDQTITSFIGIWNSTIKKSDLDRYGWEANPWVWVIEFERCEKPQEV